MRGYSTTGLAGALFALSETYPDLATLVAVPDRNGDGTEKYALAIGDRDVEPRRTLVMLGGRHAGDRVNSEALLWMASELLEARASDSDLRVGEALVSSWQIRRIFDGLRLVIVPQAISRATDQTPLVADFEAEVIQLFPGDRETTPQDPRLFLGWDPDEDQMEDHDMPCPNDVFDGNRCRPELDEDGFVDAQDAWSMDQLSHLMSDEVDRVHGGGWDVSPAEMLEMAARARARNGEAAENHQTPADTGQTGFRKTMQGGLHAISGVAAAMIAFAEDTPEVVGTGT